jgi:hypothetical protein
MSETAHQPCPYPSCGSSDAFSYNTGGFGKCHKCDRPYPSKERMYDWAKERYPVQLIEETLPPRPFDLSPPTVENGLRCVGLPP